MYILVSPKSMVLECLETQRIGGLVGWGWVGGKNGVATHVGAKLIPDVGLSISKKVVLFCLASERGKEHKTSFCNRVFVTFVVGYRAFPVVRRMGTPFRNDGGWGCKARRSTLRHVDKSLGTVVSLYRSNFLMRSAAHHHDHPPPFPSRWHSHPSYDSRQIAMLKDREGGGDFGNNI